VARSQLSLRWRVTLAIVVTAATGMTAFSYVAYSIVRQSIVGAAEARMLGAIQSLTQAPSTAAAARERRLADIAAHPAVVAAIAAPTPANLGAASRIIAPLGPDTGLAVVTELRNAAGATLLTLGGAIPDGARPVAATDTATASPMFVRGDDVLIEYGAPVWRGGAVVGRVSQWRRATTSGANPALDRLRGLVGADAAFLIGNADGSVWTDLQRRVERPPPSFDRSVTYDRDGRRRIAISSRYPTGGLVAAIEFPESVVVAPLQRLLWTLVGIGAIVLTGVAAAGWFASSGVTRPVHDLTHAAERIAAGDLTSPVAIHAAEPIDRLGLAFESMRLSVKAGHDTLEDQVTTRTRELRDAQAELVKKERLAILGQLSSSVGHELRNPLGVMTNAIYFLEMTQRDAPQKVKDYLGILRAQVRLSEKIVSDLLDFARVKPPQRARTTAQQIVADQLARVTVPASVRVVQEFDAALPALNVDPVQVGQVMLNLLTNGVQAMEETGGTLTIRGASAGGRLRLEVADTGPGIAPEHLDHVFEPLFTTKARGIGLGLSVSRSLAAANDGRLTVASEPGHGAAFTLDLPVEGA
jgi:signal transduction histidine kinase